VYAFPEFLPAYLDEFVRVSQSKSRQAFRVSPHDVLAPRELRSVRGPVSASSVQKFASQFVASEFVASAYRVPVSLRPLASSSVASSVVASRSVSLRPVALRQFELPQSVLRQAFSQVPVPRSRPRQPSRSVASCVAASPIVSLPKCSLSSALHTSMRASRAEKVSRLVRRLATLVPVASV
jgi:hypothetical protein